MSKRLIEIVDDEPHTVHIVIDERPAACNLRYIYTRLYMEK